MLSPIAERTCCLRMLVLGMHLSVEKNSIWAADDGWNRQNLGLQVEHMVEPYRRLPVCADDFDKVILLWCRRCDGWRVRPLRGWNLSDRIGSATTALFAHTFYLYQSARSGYNTF